MYNMEYTLENLEVYQIAENFSDRIWNIAVGWKFFEKDTIGKQMTRAADSISANIAEGYGRYFYKESKQFYYYSRGSLQETKSWLSKCRRRNLIEPDTCDELLAEAEKLLVKLNSYIRFIKNSKNHNPKYPDNE